MDSDFGSGSSLMMNVSGSGLMNESDSDSGFMNVFGSGSGSSSDSGSDSGSGSGPNRSSALCLNVTIFGDDIVEGVEYIYITFTPLNNQVAFAGSSEAQVRIVDDDGELKKIHIAAQLQDIPVVFEIYMYIAECNKGAQFSIIIFTRFKITFPT
jgi:hypothetical protein